MDIPLGDSVHGCDDLFVVPCVTFAAMHDDAKVNIRLPGDVPLEYLLAGHFVANDESAPACDGKVSGNLHTDEGLPVPRLRSDQIRLTPHAAVKQLIKSIDASGNWLVPWVAGWRQVISNPFLNRLADRNRNVGRDVFPNAFQFGDDICKVGVSIVRVGESKLGNLHPESNHAPAACGLFQFGTMRAGCCL